MECMECMERKKRDCRQTLIAANVFLCSSIFHIDTRINSLFHTHILRSNIHEMLPLMKYMCDDRTNNRSYFYTVPDVQQSHEVAPKQPEKSLILKMMNMLKTLRMKEKERKERKEMDTNRLCIKYASKYFNFHRDFVGLAHTRGPFLASGW